MLITAETKHNPYTYDFSISFFILKIKLFIMKKKVRERKKDRGRDMKRNILAAGMCALMLSLTGCKAPDIVEEEHVPQIFGATYMTRNNPYFDVLHEAIENVVEGNGDIVISRDPCQDQQKQNDQILEMLDEGIKVLFLNPVDWELVEPALEACREKGVIVINMDTVVKNKDYVVSIVETDNYEAGAQCARDMMDRVNHAKIVILDNPTQTSISDRVKGFMDTIAESEQADNYRVVARKCAQGEFEIGAEAMASILDRGIECDVVLGGNDPSALGALATLQQYHKEKGVLIYGIDGSPDFKSMLNLGYVTGSSGQEPRKIGEVAAQTAYDYLAGKEVESYISIKPYMITQENLDQYEISSWGR